MTWAGKPREAAVVAAPTLKLLSLPHQRPCQPAMVNSFCKLLNSLLLDRGEPSEKRYKGPGKDPRMLIYDISAATGHKVQSDLAKRIQQPFPNWSLFDLGKFKYTVSGRGDLSILMQAIERWTPS